MGVTYQSYEWMNVARDVNAVSQVLSSDLSYDIFTGTVGNSISTANLVRPTQFIVIEDVGVTPFSGANLQLVINTTSYFQNPDNTVGGGIPGLAAPYPVGCASGNVTNLTDAVLPFNIMKQIPVYILPGQHWTFEFNVVSSIALSEAGAAVGCSVVYTLYDGVDALIANKLLESGFGITQENIDNYKMNLLSQNTIGDGN